MALGSSVQATGRFASGHNPIRDAIDGDGERAALRGGGLVYDRCRGRNSSDE